MYKPQKFHNIENSKHISNHYNLSTVFLISKIPRIYSSVKYDFPSTSMGAEHDGQENSCDPNAQYLMTAVQTGQGINNHHTFSSCSINYFDKHASMKEK